MGVNTTKPEGERKPSLNTLRSRRFHSGCIRCTAEGPIFLCALVPAPATAAEGDTACIWVNDFAGSNALEVCRGQRWVPRDRERLDVLVRPQLELTDGCNPDNRRRMPVEQQERHIPIQLKDWACDTVPQTIHSTTKPTVLHILQHRHPQPYKIHSPAHCTAPHSAHAFGIGSPTQCTAPHIPQHHLLRS